jgi:hypothetical protein
MTATRLKSEITKAIKNMDVERLSTVADFVSFISRPTTTQRLQSAEKAIQDGKGTNWRKVRSDV